MASNVENCEIILCTDGLSNVGIGSLDTDSNLTKEEQEAFYNDIGELAKSQRTTISVIGIKGENSNCALSIIGKCGDITAGIVNMNHPLELLTQIVKISQRPVVATKVSVVNISPSSYRWNCIDHPEESSENGDMVKFFVGNATIETDLTFEFECINPEKGYKKNIPFQVQITYTKVEDNSQYLRVITTNMKCSKRREKSELNCDCALIALHTIQSLSKKLLLENKKKISPSMRDYLLSTKKLIERSIENTNSDNSREELEIYIDQALDLDQYLTKKKNRLER